MLAGLFSKKGISMIDVTMAICLTLIAITALLSIIPQGWTLAGRADQQTRATEILHRELENTQMLIMNPCNIVSTGTVPDKPVYSSGSPASLAGDRSFTVKKTITQGIGGWTMTVTVLWPGTSRGVFESRFVTRQDDYKDDPACVTNPPARDVQALY